MLTLTKIGLLAICSLSPINLLDGENAIRIKESKEKTTVIKTNKSFSNVRLKQDSIIIDDITYAIKYKKIKYVEKSKGKHITVSTVKYENDTIAKLAMVIAELGGSIVKYATDEELENEVLIISASMDNRLKIDTLSNKNDFSSNKTRQVFGEGTYQSLYKVKQYYAVKEKAYKDMNYVMVGRYGKYENKLTIVYNALFNSVEKLKARGFENANEILSYAHKGNPKLWKNKTLKVTIPVHKICRVNSSYRERFQSILKTK